MDEEEIILKAKHLHTIFAMIPMDIPLRNLLPMMQMKKILQQPDISVS